MCYGSEYYPCYRCISPDGFELVSKYVNDRAEDRFSTLLEPVVAPSISKKVLALLLQYPEYL